MLEGLRLLITASATLRSLVWRSFSGRLLLRVDLELLLMPMRLRINVDHISDILFAPTELAKRNLEEEKVMGQICVTGNTVIDAIDMYFDRVKEVEDRVLEQVKFEEYALVTMRRAENVDDPKNLKNFAEILGGSQYQPST